MVIALDPKDEFDYILEADRELDEEYQTTFKLKVLSVRQFANLEDKLGTLDKEGNYHMRIGSQVVDVLNVGLKGWENLKDSESKEVDFDREKGSPHNLTDTTFRRLSPDHRRELANAIMSANTPDEELVKKSE